MKHKRMLTVVFSLILALTLSICSVFADNFSSPELPSDEELLTLVEDSVNAYKKQYIIHSVDIANKCIQSTSQNGYTVDFTVALDVELNYDSALQLPHVQGMLALLGIDASSTSTDVFLNKLDTDTLDVAISKIAQGQMSLSNSVSEKSAKIDVESAERITNTVKEELADFILELEDLYRNGNYDADSIPTNEEGWPMALNELVDGLFVVNGQVFARGRLARTGMAEIWVLCDGAGGAVWG